MKKIILSILFCCVAFGQTPAPVPVPVQAPGEISIVSAFGVSSQTKYETAAIGISETISATQDVFITALLSPAPGTNTEQTSILLGVTQGIAVPPIPWLKGIKMHPWVSAAYGSSLKNISKLNLALSPSAIVASAGTNAAFTQQYVFGVGFTPSFCKQCEMGPIVRRLAVTGDPGQLDVGIYLKWKPQ